VVPVFNLARVIKNNNKKILYISILILRIIYKKHLNARIFRFEKVIQMYRGLE